MSVDPKQVQALFLAAAECTDPVERAVLLERDCQGNADLRARVEALLKAHDEPDDFLHAPLGAIESTFIPPQDYSAGAVIGGRYKLLEVIAEGGMGTVWVAQQTEPVRRRVAMKLIKPGMDSRQVLSRFDVERQALALMDHPNIAKVLDGGMTDQGRPFFVMEYVKGVPITDFCDEARLGVRQRLDLFVQVCQAVQHAHQKGIIHRDLKPSNILVCLYDGRPVPKVIDFGLAKAVNQPLTEHTLYTAHGLMVGTPLYMSPEQAEFNNLDIDTRTDVYSLGVILYELLTGTTPMERQRFKNAAWQEILRLIKEEEPPKPSTKLSGGDTLPKVAAQRSLEPAQVSRAIRGDLDWIVMKSLEKERSRRYETANGLARDIDRFLHDQTVEASPPSTLYRFRKFARRNRVALTTGVLVSMAMVVGTVVSINQAIRATRAEGKALEAQQDEAVQRDIAEKRRKDAEEARAAEADQRKVAETERQQAVEQRKAAEENFQKARKAVDKYFIVVSESRLFDVPGLQSLRKELLEAALKFYGGFADERTNDPAALADVASTSLRVAVISTFVDRNDDAVTALNRAVDAVMRLRKDFPEAKEQHRRLAGYWKGSRRTVESTELPKDPKAAFQSLIRFTETWEALAKEFPDEVGFQSDLAAVYGFQGDLLASQNLKREGLNYFHKGKAILERLAKEQPLVPEYRADLARAYQLISSQLRFLGQTDPDPIAADRQALALREQLVEQYPKLAQYREDLTESLIRCAPRTETTEEGQEKFYRRALALNESLLAESPTMPVYLSQNVRVSQPLGEILRKRGELPEAEKLLRRTYDRQIAILAGNPRDEEERYRFSLTSTSLLNLYVAADRHEEAKQVAQQAMAIIGDNSDRLNGVAWGLVYPSDATVAAGQMAIPFAQKSVELAANDMARANALNTLGVAQFRAGNWKEAESALRQSIKLAGDARAIDTFILAMTDWHQDKKENARKWFHAAELWTKKYAPKSGELLQFQSEACDLLELKPETTDRPADDLTLAQALLDADPSATCYRRRGNAYVGLGEWDRAAEDFEKAVQLDPEYELGWQNRIGILAYTKRWADAISIAEQYAKSHPNNDTFQQQLLCLLAHAPDSSSYLSLSRELLNKFAETSDASAATRVSKACLILPAKGELTLTAQRMAQRSLLLSEKHPDTAEAAFVVSALSAYRDGKFQSALEWCDKALAPPDMKLVYRNMQASCLRAMACARLNQSAPAKAAMAQADAAFEQMQSETRAPTDSIWWHEYANGELLHREAAEVLKGLP